jgi:hypothetical protein
MINNVNLSRVYPNLINGNPEYSNNRKEITFHSKQTMTSGQKMFVYAIPLMK